MCGNGARCFTAFVSHLSGGKITKLCFETLAGTVRGLVNPDGSVSIRLTNPHGLKLNILPADGIIPAPVHFLNTGVPHAVVFLPDVENIDLNTMGAYLRYHRSFAPAGTNADFATVLSDRHLRLRTYERGVEGETLACGTGITATALLHAALTGAASPIKVDAAGGDTLSVAFTRIGSTEFSDVTLTGPATIVFRGEISVPS